jgi:uncharacterized SAM-binding protein YcdF (DUF218 family)
MEKRPINRTLPIIARPVLIGLFSSLLLPILVGLLLLSPWGASALGNWLDASADAKGPPLGVVFVLSGNATDRGEAAAQLYGAGLAQRLVFTGQLVPESVRALGMSATESQLGRAVALRAGVPAAAIVDTAIGTSTHEECLWLVLHCREQGLKRVGVLSHRFHTRRIQWQLERILTPNDSITVLLLGASASDYREESWWQAEGGLLFVTNEYLKLAYYLVRY